MMSSEERNAFFEHIANNSTVSDKPVEVRVNDVHPMEDASPTLIKMRQLGLDPFDDILPGDARWEMMFGKGRLPNVYQNTPYQHTFVVRVMKDDGHIIIAETYEGIRDGHYLANFWEDLIDMGARPDGDFSYAWTLPYTPTNWRKVMTFIHKTDRLLEPSRAPYGMCWHCGLAVSGEVCPACGRELQIWYDSPVEIENYNEEAAKEMLRGIDNIPTQIESTETKVWDLDHVKARDIDLDVIGVKSFAFANAY